MVGIIEGTYIINNRHRIPPDKLDARVIFFSEVPVAIIEQKQLFGWKEIEFLGDLERLYLVLNNLPDEELMRSMLKSA